MKNYYFINCNANDFFKKIGTNIINYDKFNINKILFKIVLNRISTVKKN